MSVGTARDIAGRGLVVGSVAGLAVAVLCLISAWGLYVVEGGKPRPYDNYTRLVTVFRALVAVGLVSGLLGVETVRAVAATHGMTRVAALLGGLEALLLLLACGGLALSIPVGGVHGR